MTEQRTPKPSVWVRILVSWLVANFLLAGAASWLVGGWYLGWETSTAARMLAEMVLIMLPNLVIPVVVLRHWWPEPSHDLKRALGWVWNGWRSLVVGIGAFLLAIGWMAAAVTLLGGSIPYNPPGNEGPIQAHSLVGALGVLVLLVAFVLLTVAAEETMFRGFIQAQVSERSGAWMGLLLGALLFGLRHLPADFFYANAWGATPRMWLARQMQLYGAALLFGLARHFGRSTYAPAIMHALILVVSLFG